MTTDRDEIKKRKKRVDRLIQRHAVLTVRLPLTEYYNEVRDEEIESFLGELKIVRALAGDARAELFERMRDFWEKELEKRRRGARAMLAFHSIL